MQKVISKPCSPDELYKYEGNFYKMYLSGDIQPYIAATKEQKEALRKGTEGAKRYRGGINNKARKTFISRVAYMHNTKRGYGALKVFVLTYNKNPDDPKECKKHVNKFLTRFKQVAKLHSWAYTVETGKKGGLIHFHFIVDCDWVDIQKLNKVWCNIRGYYSGNAIQDFKFVYSFEGAACYAAKYATKAKEADTETLKGLRRWATSNNLCGKEFITIEKRQLQELDQNEINAIEHSVFKEDGQLTFSINTAKISFKLAYELYKEQRKTYIIQKKAAELMQKKKQQELEDFTKWIHDFNKLQNKKPPKRQPPTEKNMAIIQNTFATKHLFE